MQVVGLGRIVRRARGSVRPVRPPEASHCHAMMPYRPQAPSPEVRTSTADFGN